MVGMVVGWGWYGGFRVQYGGMVVVEYGGMVVVGFGGRHGMVGGIVWCQHTQVISNPARQTLRKPPSLQLEKRS